MKILLIKIKTYILISSTKVLFNPVKTYLASYLILYLAWICINVFADLTSTSPEAIQNLLDEDSSKREAWVNSVNKPKIQKELETMVIKEGAIGNIILYFVEETGCDRKEALSAFKEYLKNIEIHPDTSEAINDMKIVVTGLENYINRVGFDTAMKHLELEDD
jgi:hypothetical protein